MISTLRCSPKPTGKRVGNLPNSERSREAIVVPGLNDTSFVTWLTLKLLNWQWNKLGITVHVVPMRWHDSSETYEQKYSEFCLKVQEIWLLNQQKLIVAGISAGSSVAFRFADENPHFVDSAINICGMLRANNPQARQTLEKTKKVYPAFSKAVEYYSNLERQAHRRPRVKSMTIYPRHDQHMPPESVRQEGSQELEVPAYEHIWGILAACSARELQEFLASS